MRCLTAALMLTATAAAPAMADMPPGVSHFTLPNGLEAVVIEDHRAPVVVQMVWYRIGSADEVPGKTGLAHYLEHLMFKGTDRLAAGELSKTVTANGGSDNAFTSYDFTTYFQRIAADRLDLVMGMEADRMAHLKIGEDDWQAERQVVLAERAQRTDSDPAALFGEESAAVQFYNHPYGRPVIGWRAEMEGLTRDDALAWYHAHYAPNAAVLVVAGDVTPEEVRRLAERHYGPIPARPEALRGPRPQEPAQRTERHIEMRDPRVPQPSVSRSVIVPERNRGEQKQAAALTVLAELLGGSPQTSVLGRKLVMTGKALWAGASYDGLTVDPTTFAVSMAYPPGTDKDQAEAELDAAVDAFLAEGPDPAQLERVKTQLRAARIYERDSAHGRAYDYGQGLAIGLAVEDVNAWPDLLAAVTADDVRAAARLALRRTGSVTAHLLPAPQDEGAPASAVAAGDMAAVHADGTAADGMAAGGAPADGAPPAGAAAPAGADTPHPAAAPAALPAAPADPQPAAPQPMGAGPAAGGDAGAAVNGAASAAQPAGAPARPSGASPDAPPLGPSGTSPDTPPEPAQTKAEQ